MRSVVVVVLALGALPAQAQLSPDLMVSSATVSAMAFRGEDARVEVTITNIGDASAVGFVVGAGLGPGGVAAASLSRRLSLAAQTSTAVTIELPVPYTVPVGPIQVTIIVDLDSTVAERRETNNLVVRSTTVADRQTDLTGRFLAAALEARPQEPVDISVAIDNLGPGRMLASAANCELLTASGAAVLVYTFSLSNLGPGQTYSEGATPLLPLSLAPGVYRWRLVVDALGDVAETDETNNVVLGPELVVGELRPQITTRRLMPAFVGRPYRDTLQGFPEPITWSMVSVLPLGLSLDTATGVISGTPRITDPGPLRVRATRQGQSAEQDVAFVIRPAALALGPERPPPVIVETPFSFTFSASGGTPPYTFLVIGELPPGITLDPRGVLGGASSTTGVSRFEVGVVDSERNRAQGLVELLVLAAAEPLVIETTSLPSGRVGDDYCAKGVVLSARGGTPPLRWRLTGARPAGLELSTEGRLCGTPTEAGTFALEVGASDVGGQEAWAKLALTIEARAPAPTASPSSAPNLGLETTGPVGCGCGVTTEEPVQTSVLVVLVMLPLALRRARRRGRERISSNG